MNGHEAHARARDMFARALQIVRNPATAIGAAFPDGAACYFTRYQQEAIDTVEGDFHEAMADLNRELQRGHAMAAALREYAARHDALAAALEGDAPRDLATIANLIIDKTNAATILAEIGREIERARHGGT